MSAYFVLQIDWTDEAGRKRYIEGLAGMIEKHGGHYIVASRDFRTVEGHWENPLLVIIEFPSMEELRGWYDSPEYRPLRDLRLRSSKSNAVVTAGT